NPYRADRRTPDLHRTALAPKPVLSLSSSTLRRPIHRRAPPPAPPPAASPPSSRPPRRHATKPPRAPPLPSAVPSAPPPAVPPVPRDIARWSPSAAASTALPEPGPPATARYKRSSLLL